MNPDPPPNVDPTVDKASSDLIAERFPTVAIATRKNRRFTCRAVTTLAQASNGTTSGTDTLERLRAPLLGRVRSLRWIR